MQIKLQTVNTKDLDIEGEHFTVDCNNLASIQALDEFAKATQSIDAVDEALIDKCHRTIDKVLGDGAYARIFKGLNNSIAPYYLCLELVRIFQSEFMKDEIDAREKEANEQLDQLDRMTKSMESLNRAANIAQSKYGGMNASNLYRRTSGKHYRK